MVACALLLTGLALERAAWVDCEPPTLMALRISVDSSHRGILAGLVHCSLL